VGRLDGRSRAWLDDGEDGDIEFDTQTFWSDSASRVAGDNQGFHVTRHEVLGAR
jgi:hypothetical protein